MLNPLQRCKKHLFILFTVFQGGTQAPKATWSDHVRQIVVRFVTASTTKVWTEKSVLTFIDLSIMVTRLRLKSIVEFRLGR